MSNIVLVDPQTLERLADSQVQWGDEPTLSVSIEQVFEQTLEFFNSCDKELIECLYIKKMSHKSIACQKGCTPANIHHHEKRIWRKMRSVMDTEQIRDSLLSNLDLFNERQQDVIKLLCRLNGVTTIARKLDVSRMQIYRRIQAIAKIDPEIKTLLSYIPE